MESIGANGFSNQLSCEGAIDVKFVTPLDALGLGTARGRNTEFAAHAYEDIDGFALQFFVKLEGTDLTVVGNDEVGRLARIEYLFAQRSHFGPRNVSRNGEPYVRRRRQRVDFSASDNRQRLTLWRGDEAGGLRYPDVFDIGLPLYLASTESKTCNKAGH